MEQAKIYVVLFVEPMGCEDPELCVAFSSFEGADKYIEEMGPKETRDGYYQIADIPLKA